MQLAEDTITSLKNIRENIEQEFQIIYNSVKVNTLFKIKSKIFE